MPIKPKQTYENEKVRTYLLHHFSTRHRCLRRRGSLLIHCQSPALSAQHNTKTTNLKNPSPSTLLTAADASATTAATNATASSVSKAQPSLPIRRRIKTKTQTKNKKTNFDPLSKRRFRRSHRIICYKSLALFATAPLWRPRCPSRWPRCSRTTRRTRPYETFPPRLACPRTPGAQGRRNRRSVGFARSPILEAQRNTKENSTA